MDGSWIDGYSFENFEIVKEIYYKDLGAIPSPSPPFQISLSPSPIDDPLVLALVVSPIFERELSFPSSEAIDKNLIPNLVGISKDNSDSIRISLFRNPKITYRKMNNQIPSKSNGNFTSDQCKWINPKVSSLF